MELSKELEIGRAGEYFAVFSLISQGYCAYLTDQGLLYDIAVDMEGRVLRGQVKSTLGLGDYGKSKSVYRFGTRRAKKGSRLASISDCDFYAFVSVNDKKIAFVFCSDLESKKNKGTIKQTMDFSGESVKPTTKLRVDGKHRKSTRNNIENYESFSEAIKKKIS